MTIFDFSTFHHRTQAAFWTTTPPAREPDYVSPARSVYWDLGHAVVRASDHWAGSDGCTGQATCVWTLADDQDGSGWRFGQCAYAAFTPNRTQPSVLTPHDRDRTIAAWLLAHNGACTPTAWEAQGWGQPPAWVHRVPRGSLAATRAAEQIFALHPTLTTVLCARIASVKAALNGDPIPWF